MAEGTPKSHQKYARTREPKPSEEQLEMMENLKRYIVLLYQGKDFKNLLRNYDNLEKIEGVKYESDELGPRMQDVFAKNMKGLKIKQ